MYAIHMNTYVYMVTIPAIGVAMPAQQPLLRRRIHIRCRQHWFCETSCVQRIKVRLHFSNNILSTASPFEVLVPLLDLCLCFFCVSLYAREYVYVFITSPSPQISQRSVKVLPCVRCADPSPV